jgi:hypothetical protein
MVFAERPAEAPAKTNKKRVWRKRLLHIEFILIGVQ